MDEEKIHEPEIEIETEKEVAPVMMHHQSGGQAKRYKALVGIDNDEIDVHLQAGDEVPQSLLDACPELLTAFDPPVLEEA